MCILFIYNGSQIEQSDYSLIIISNRDEILYRSSQIMAPWPDHPHIVGGRDLKIGGGGTWLALSPVRKKLGVLLNLPGSKNRSDASSRGRIVADYVRSYNPFQDYIEDSKDYIKDCNGFIFVAAELSKTAPSIYSYNNVTDQLLSHTDTCLGFGNCLPDAPLKKVTAGTDKLKSICDTFNKVIFERELIEKLLQLLKSDKKHLPDQELQKRRPDLYHELSSIYVTTPNRQYGTRTHTLVLLTKTGRLNITEFTIQPPFDDSSWNKSEFMFDLDSSKKVAAPFVL